MHMDPSASRSPPAPRALRFHGSKGSMSTSGNALSCIFCQVKDDAQASTHKKRGAQARRPVEDKQKENPQGGHFRPHPRINQITSDTSNRIQTCNDKHMDWKRQAIQ